MLLCLKSLPRVTPRVARRNKYSRPGECTAQRFDHRRLPLPPAEAVVGRWQKIKHRSRATVSASVPARVPYCDVGRFSSPFDDGLAFCFPCQCLTISRPALLLTHTPLLLVWKNHSPMDGWVDGRMTMPPFHTYILRQKAAQADDAACLRLSVNKATTTNERTNDDDDVDERTPTNERTSNNPNSYLIYNHYSTFSRHYHRSLKAYS